MRPIPLLVVAAALTASCSAPADVVVSGGGPRVDGTTEPTPEVTEAVPVTDVAVASTAPGEHLPIQPAKRELAALLLQEGDLADWVHLGPSPSGGEPTFVSADCDTMTAVWAAAEQPGVRVRAALGDTRVRQTAVEFDTVEEASAVLTAASAVWEECIRFTDDLGDAWWVEPIPVPAAGERAAGVVVGGTDILGWAIAFWQVGPVVVVLDVNGDDMWLHLEDVFATAAARVGGAPLPGSSPAASTTVPGERPVPQPPVDPTAPPIDTLPPVASLPPIDSLPPAFDPTGWPPSHERWADHSLAPLAPRPSALGSGWTFSHGDATDAAPGDQTNMIDGCDVAAPPTLSGLSLSYDRDGGAIGYSELEIEIGTGGPQEISEIVGALRAVADCDLSSAGFPGGLELATGIRPDGALDSVVLTGELGEDGIIGTAVIAGAVYGDLLVFVFLVAPDATEVVVGEALAVLDLVAAAR